MPRRSRFSETDYGRMKELYLEGLSVHRVGEIYGVCGGTIKSALNTRGFTLKRPYKDRIYNLNELAFTTVSCEESAYWMGFLMADGCITTKHGQFSLRVWLNIKDKNHLCRFQEFIKAEQPIKEDESRSAIGITIYSRQLCSDLICWGCIPNKTLNLVFPKLADGLINHFVRGYFDGDGSIYWGKGAPTVSFIGNEDFLKAIRDKIKTAINANGSIHRHTKSRAFYLTYSGQFVVYAIYRWLYNDATIYLERKKQRFESYPKGKRQNYPTAQKYKIF